jgi:hypothetical protein
MKPNNRERGMRGTHWAYLSNNVKDMVAFWPAGTTHSYLGFRLVEEVRSEKTRPGFESWRVNRGGSWGASSSYHRIHRIANRSVDPADYDFDLIGVRLVEERKNKKAKDPRRIFRGSAYWNPYGVRSKSHKDSHPNTSTGFRLVEEIVHTNANIPQITPPEELNERPKKESRLRVSRGSRWDYEHRFALTPCSTKIRNTLSGQFLSFRLVEEIDKRE